MPNSLHNFSEVHLDEDCQQMTGNHENGLFYGCTFRNLNGLTLKDCDLNGSQFLTDSVKDALGLTLTLNCNSFKGVLLSELTMDLLLALLTMTVGNDQKRKQIVEVIGTARYAALMRVLRATE